MANIFQRALSKATFWDKSDDQRIAQEDEEERKRKRQQAASQSVSATKNVSSATPGLTIKPAETAPTPKLSIASQSQFNPSLKLQKAPANDVRIEAPEKKPLEDMEFKGIENRDRVAKKILGVDVSGVLGDKLGYRTNVKTGRNLKTNKDKYVAQFDSLDDERKKILVNDAKKRAEKGDEAAVNTIRALTETGRMKGDAMDFIEGSNDKLYGGLGRGVARSIELLPGNQGTGEWADKDAEANAQYTEAGKKGETAGSIQKGIVDVATIAIPGAKLDKVIDASNAFKAITTGSKFGAVAGRGGKIVAGSLMGTGIDAVQQVGRGDNPNLAQSAGTGLAIDLGVNALPYGAGKLAKYIQNGKADDAGVEQSIKEIYSNTSRLRKIATNTDANLDEIPQLSQLEREAVADTAETAAIPGRSEKREISSSKPSVEVAPGVKSTNIPEAANTPAYMRNVPETVGQADGQQRLTGGTLLDDSMFDADKRAIRNTPKQSELDDALDVPTFLRNQADETVARKSKEISSIDERLEKISSDPRVQAFEDKKTIADAYRESPRKGKAVERYINARNSRSVPFEARKELIGNRNAAATDLRMAEDAQAARDLLARSANIPDPSDPIALAKAADAVDDVTPQPNIQTATLDQNVADFSRSINASAPLQKVEPTDALGNDVLESDALATRQAVAAGDAPQAAPNLMTSRGDEMATEADRVATEQVTAADGAAAPRTRGRAASMIRDEDLRSEILENFPERQTMNIAETERRTIQDINNMTDDELVSSLPNNVIVETPEDFLRTVNSIRRLEGIDTPESKEAIANAVNALTDFSARSGRNLRTTQILFDDMPVALKVRTLEKQLNKAGAELDEGQMEILTSLVTRADSATDTLRTLEDEARTLLDSGRINNGTLPPEVQARASDLTSLIDEARAAKELRSGEAWRYWQEQMPNGPIGKRFGDVGRTLMLSSPTGRVFDVASTAITATDDLATRGVSNLIGKVLNKVSGAGTVQDTLPSAGQLVKGVGEGLQRSKQAFQGNDHVEDVLGEAKRSTRGDVNTGGGKLRQLVRSAVELPTNLTRGLRTDQLYREGMQEAAGLGLRGEARQTYAQLRSAVPSEQQLNEAVQTHMRANMLHDNGISRALNNMANSLDKKGGGWAAPLIRNQVMPFTSWLGGNLHRTLTDKNVLWNVGSAVNNARKGNAQGVIDDIAKLAVNTGEAYAGGMLLTQAGIITTEDANGDNYGGLYFHIGDRYIPVAAAGIVSVPIILGNGVQQAYETGAQGGSGQEVVESLINSTGLNTLKNAGVSSVFGGDNNLQSSVDTALREGGDLVSGGAQFAGNIVRQYIPALASDINAGLDQTDLNPTHEAAETKVTVENPETGRQVTDVMGTEVNKTLNKIPFASQNLDRKPDTASKDLLDRITKGNRETGEQAEVAQSKMTLKEMKAQLIRDKVPFQSEDIKTAMDDGDFEKARRGLDYQIAEEQAKPDASETKVAKLQDQRTQADMGERGVPITDDGIKARTEDGDYDKAMEGLAYQLQKAKGDKDTPKSKLKKTEDEIMRLRVASDKEYAPEVLSAYDKTSASEWRAMGNPESEDYDPDMYAILAQYDADLAANGVSASAKDGSKPKYYNNGSGSGGSGGGRGKGISTDIATNRVSFDSNFTPIKAQGANMAPAQSAIPVLNKVKNNDTSKLKKISVTKGGR